MGQVPQREADRSLPRCARSSSDAERHPATRVVAHAVVSTDAPRRAARCAPVCAHRGTGTALGAALTESYSRSSTRSTRGQVAIAHVNEETHHVQANLKNGSQQFVAFPSSQHKMLVDSLLHHGVTLIYTRKKPHLKPAPSLCTTSCATSPAASSSCCC